MKENNNKFIKIFSILKKFDTPTVCNALELLDPNLQKKGYTKKNFVCLNKLLPPIIGIARTAKIFSNLKNKKITSKELSKYYQYMDDGDLPKICLIEDSNIEPVGCFWGEVQTNIHKKMGFKGVITNGGMRDINETASNFQILAGSILPSHAYIKLQSLGKKIKIGKEYFEHDNIIHADQHGAVKIPSKYLFKLPEAIKKVHLNEKPILNLCKKKVYNLFF